MAQLTADERRFLFKAAGTDFEVLGFDGVEAVSTPFDFKIRLLAPDDHIPPLDLVRKRGRLTFKTSQEEERFVNGVISKVAIVKTGMNYAIYEVVLEPFFKLLGLRTQSRIFQDKSVPDVISKVLKDAGMAGSDFKMNLSGSYSPVNYCVQYRESDLAFVARMAAGAGIFYLFVQEKDREIMVFGDDAAAHPSCTPVDTVEFHLDTGGLNATQQVLTSCVQNARVYSGKAVISDYNYEKPDIRLKSTSAGKDHHELEVYGHPGKFETPSQGDALVKKWKEAQGLDASTLEGAGNFRCLAAGHRLNVTKHPNGNVNGLYILSKVAHRAAQPQGISQVDSGEHVITYDAWFSAIPAKVPYRPLIIEKPVASMQCAEVVGPDGDQVYMDELGRVKVRFHWDREAGENHDCTCWIRVSDGYAGASHGIQFPPLIGDDVLVDFIHGDPDQPVITGRVYNGRNTPPIDPGQVVRNLIYTEYGHEFLFDDKNQRISLRTGGAENLLMVDEDKEDGNLIRLVTTDGHTIDLAEGENLKGIQVVTKKKHTILMEDEPAPGITIRDMNDELVLNMDSKSQTITLENKTSKAINIQCQRGAINVTAKKVKVEGSSGVDVSSNSHINMTAPKVAIKAGRSLTAEAGMDATFKGGMTAKVQGGAMTDIKGGLVKIN